MDLLTAKTLDGSLLATPEAATALRAHALAAFPQECLGYIDRFGQYRPLVNKAKDPTRFAVPDMAILAHLMAEGEIRALCHSHPNRADAPSEADMRWQIDLELPFVLLATNGQATTAPFAWGDQLVDERPLIGRPFRHGVTDCYATIRAWYRQEGGIILPDYPRNWDWWTDAAPGEKDLYRRYFADAGFVEVERTDPREGDVFLACMKSDVPNHAGIYLDGGLALHHPSTGRPYDPTRLSKRDPIARWLPWVTHWLRRI